MKYVKTLCTAAALAVVSANPTYAEDMRPGSVQAQVAENGLEKSLRNVSAEIPIARRNVTAIDKVEIPGSAAATARDPDTLKPPAAQALMALGIALIVTPSMFGGAFAN